MVQYTSLASPAQDEDSDRETVVDAQPPSSVRPLDHSHHDTIEVSLHEEDRDDSHLLSSTTSHTPSRDDEDSTNEAHVVTSTQSTPLPVFPVVIICIILFGESFVSTMLFPYVNFMVRDFGVATDDKSVGYYSGYLASAFFLGQFISSFFWGYLSDKIGRRPVLLIGIAGSTISVSFFGLSPSYGIALMIRTFGGLMNSNFTICRAYLGDITDTTNRAKGFSFVSLMWGAGGVVGPALGGLLSNPKKNLPFELSDDNILNIHPYLLPSIVAGSISIISFIIALLFLKESRVFPTEDPVVLHEVKTQDSSEDSEEFLEMTEVKESDIKQYIRRENEEGFAASINVDSLADAKMSMSHPQESRLTRFANWIWPKRKTNTYVELSRMTSNSKAKRPTVVVAEKVSPVKLVCSNRAVLTTIVVQSFQSLTVVCIDEVFPLWASTLPPNGLGISSANIGLIWSVGGVSMIIFQGFIYTKLVKILGYLTALRLGITVFTIDMILYPTIGQLVVAGYVPWIAMGFCQVLRYVGGSTAGTTLFVVLNSVGGSEVQKHRGTVNGFATSVSGLSRAFAPSLGASVFAWSTTNSSFPINYYLIFEVLALISLLCFVLSFLWTKKDLKD